MNTGQDEKQNRLSVVLPNYNHGHLLARAVEALRRQELQPDEIILIDDASTDASVAPRVGARSTLPCSIPGSVTSEVYLC